LLPIILAFLPVSRIMSQRFLPPAPPFLSLVMFNLSQFDPLPVDN
jgi:hypothetical protein